MSRRVVIITEIIAPYRIPVFNALAGCEGINLHVIFLDETDLTQRQWRVYKDEIRFSYQILPSWRRRTRKHNLLLNWGLSSALSHAAPELIVCGGYNYLASWTAMSWARRNGVAFFLWVESTTRDFRSRNALIEFFKKSFLRRSDGFMVPGKSSFAYLRSYDVPEEIIFTAPNAVDNDFFKQRAQAARSNAATSLRALRLPPRFFLFVGRLVSEKGVFELLQAYSDLPPELRNEIGLVFVGNGDAEAELKKRAAGITPGVLQFTGFAQREQLATYYGLAELFVFPTQTDPWGLVVNEAMACGLPVICSDSAGCAADLVEDRWNGRIVAAGDVRELVAAMEEIARNPEMRALMGQRSRERIQCYSPETWAAGMAQAALQSGGGVHA